MVGRGEREERKKKGESGDEKDMYCLNVREEERKKKRRRERIDRMNYRKKRGRGKSGDVTNGRGRVPF